MEVTSRSLAANQLPAVLFDARSKTPVKNPPLSNGDPVMQTKKMRFGGQAKHMSHASVYLQWAAQVEALDTSITAVK